MTAPDDSAATVDATTDAAGARARAGDRAQAVASDLDGIFASVGARPPPRPVKVAAPPPPEDPTGPAPRALRGPLIAAAAALLILGPAGVYVARQLSRPPAAPTTAGRDQIEVQVVPETPADSYAALAVDPSVASIGPAPLAPPAPRAPEPVRAEPPIASRPPARTPPPVRRPATATPQPRAAPVAPRAPTPAISAPQRFAAPASRAPVAVARGPEGCASLPPSPAREECFYPLLRDADARLRRAYDAAREVGVPRGVLDTYSREWDELRRRGAREPLEVIDTYRAMSAELDDYAGQDSGPG